MFLSSLLCRKASAVRRPVDCGESADSDEAYAIESSRAGRTRPQAEVVLTTGVGGPERRALYPQQPAIGGLLFVAFGACLAFPRSLCLAFWQSGVAELLLLGFVSIFQQMLQSWQGFGDNGNLI